MREPRNGCPGARRPRRLFAIAFAVAALGVAASAGSAQALVSDPWTNPSFDGGDLNAWQSSGQVVPDANGNPQAPATAVQLYAKNYRTPDPGRVFGYKPPLWLDGTVGSHYGLVLSGCNGTRDLDPPGTSSLRRTFQVANAGDVLSGYSFFKSNDYYNDEGTVRILDADGDVVQTVFHMDQATIGTYMGTAWTAWSYEFTAPGTYTLEAESTSGNDCEAPSALGLDLPTPNPLKMGQTISYDEPAKTYGDADFDLGATATAGHPVTLTSNTPGVCTIVDGQVHIVGAGFCDLTAKTPGDLDYAPKTQTIRFSIAKAPVTIDADDQTKGFGGADPPLTYELNGFINGEDRNSANFTGEADCSIAAGAGPAIGSYTNAITCEPGTLDSPNFRAQTGVQGTLTITKADQTIDFPAPSAKSVLDDDFDPGATASSGLPVSYATATPSVCTVVDGEVHIVGAGDCTIIASQAGDENHAAAQEVSRTFAVEKVGQSIDFAAPADRTYGDADFDPGATASSGLPVGYTSSTPGVCTLVAGQVHIVGAGECTITAAQPGDATYDAAEDVARTFTVAKADQAITLGGPSGLDVASADFNPGGTASSGLPVGYTSSTPDVCTIVNGQVHIVGAGDCTITASQAGDDNFNAAPEVSVTFAVAKAPQAITFVAPTDKTTESPDFDPGAAASSGLAVSYSSSTPDVCTVTGDGQVHIVGAGDCTITASQAGNGSYLAADDVIRTFTVANHVAKQNQTISFYIPYWKDFDYGDPDYDPHASASSGLPVTYTSQTPSVCTIVDGKIRFVGAGVCTVTASQDGDDTYNAAQSVTRLFTVDKAKQTITFNPTDKTVGDPDFDPGATASSGLEVTYTSSTPSVCTVAPEGKIHLVGPGKCTIRATQAGNENYDSVKVCRSFMVKAPQLPPPTVTITTPQDGATYYEGQTIKADYSCEAASGLTIASCSGDVAKGSAINTSDPGTRTFTVTATDSAGNQAQKTVTYTVIAVGKCKGGAFVIGDRNADVGTKVTYWGSQWSKENQLSGGSAPSSFKGFADSASSSWWNWGSRWTTRPGNSSRPPESVPEYMAVIVTSNVAQSRSVIGGDNPKVVVVKTDPGYDSNPGHPGTGTVVANLSG